jgi:hypothetical protein
MLTCYYYYYTQIQIFIFLLVVILLQIIDIYYVVIYGIRVLNLLACQRSGRGGKTKVWGN